MDDRADRCEIAKNCRMCRYFCEVTRLDSYAETIEVCAFSAMFYNTAEVIEVVPETDWDCEAYEEDQR